VFIAAWAFETLSCPTIRNEIMKQKSKMNDKPQAEINTVLYAVAPNPKLSTDAIALEGAVVSRGNGIGATKGVLSFSTVFPSHHPRKGEPTYFVQKIWKGLVEEPDDALYSHDVAGHWSVYKEIHNTIKPKFHTLRAGNRFKVGDFFLPRIWSGKPYCSKQFSIWNPIQVRKTWDVKITIEKFTFELLLEGKLPKDLEEIAINDGLSVYDFIYWFRYKKSHFEMDGQIICWNDSIDYGSNKPIIKSREGLTQHYFYEPTRI